jgi:hypothetical protein
MMVLKFGSPQPGDRGFPTMPRQRLSALAVLLLIAPASASADAPASVPAPMDAAEFDTLHRMLRPQPGESRWMEIDWHPSVWEARQKAAAAGKPIFIMAGSGGAPPAGC